jgi:hypothetical protein
MSPSGAESLTTKSSFSPLGVFGRPRKWPMRHGSRSNAKSPQVYTSPPASPLPPRTGAPRPALIAPPPARARGRRARRARARPARPGPGRRPARARGGAALLRFKSTRAEARTRSSTGAHQALILIDANGAPQRPVGVTTEPCGASNKVMRHHACNMPRQAILPDAQDRAFRRVTGQREPAQPSHALPDDPGRGWGRQGCTRRRPANTVHAQKVGMDSSQSQEDACTASMRAELPTLNVRSSRGR